MRRSLLLALVILLGTASEAAVAVAREVTADPGLIYPGISIAGANVGGFTIQQATATARAIAGERLSRTLVLRVDGERLALPYAALGLRVHTDEAVARAYALGRTGGIWQRLITRMRLSLQPVDIPIRHSHTEALVSALLTDLADEVSVAPHDAEVTVLDGAVVITRPSQRGWMLHVSATAARIKAAMDAGSDQVEAAVGIIRPRVSMQAALELRVPLASYTTTMAANPDRTYNIALAAGLVHGRILAPGEVFSYNQTVGPRTIERGFRPAPILLDDELVPGDGGGICQVSSTLFNVALLADLEVIARANHTRPVPYLPMGRDATVIYGALDLRVRNRTGSHVLLWTKVTGRRLTITVYGTPAPGKEVSVNVSEPEVIPPPAHTVTKGDPELAVGKVLTREAQPGYRVKTYRLVKVDGQPVRSELVGTSYYRPIPRTIKIGTRKSKQVSFVL